MSGYKITIRNYRNVPYNKPLEFVLNDGITFILGINNVGKTNLLKLFYEFRPLFKTILTGVTAGVIQNFNFDAMVNRSSMNDPIIVEIENGGMRSSITIKGAGQSQNSATFKTEMDGLNLSHHLKPIITLFSQTFYIPTVRSISKQIAPQNLDIIGGSHFVNVWDNWANGENYRTRLKVDALKAELRELFCFERFDIQPSQDGNSLFITTDDGVFKIDELGDGIAHFILVLGNVLFKEPAIILIDEPENGLHPRLQEVFMRALASKSTYGVLATSHSIGLARSVGDSIFSLTRNPDGGSKLAPFGEHHPLTISQSLTEMGYSQFVELGGNNLLLVEGRTDVKSFREILRMFGIEQHFIILSLGGANFIGLQDKAKIHEELDELRRLNPKSISVIFDSEKTSASMSFDSRFQVFHDVCKEMGFNVFPTEFHSTENYLKQTSIDSVVGSQYKALQPFEKLGSVNQKWDKNKNWLMFREMKKEDFAGTELDKFITDSLLPNCKND